MQDALSQLEAIKKEQTSLLGENKQLQTRVDSLQGQIEEATEEKASADDKIRQLEARMADYERENAELKRRIELIGSLRRQSEEPISLKQTNSCESVKQASQDDMMVVDSAWSQAQAFGSDHSQSERFNQLMQMEPTQQARIAESEADNYYNPMPAKRFSKHY